MRETNLVELAGEGHEEEGQLEHHCHDQRDEEQVVIVRDWRTHVPRNVLESAPKQPTKRHTDLRRQEVVARYPVAGSHPIDGLTRPHCWSGEFASVSRGEMMSVKVG